MTATASFTYGLRLDRSTQTLCRVLALLAQRDEEVLALRLVPRREGNLLLLSTALAGADRAEIVAAKMRMIVGVDMVRVRPRSACLSGGDPAGLSR